MTEGSDRTFLVRVEPPAGDGPRLAVKDCIDVAGMPTTLGSAVVAAQARPAEADAVCVARARVAGARLVGKVNLHELCFGATGINPHFGTPRNPLDPGRIPGGSSSGSAVAVATGEADVAFGTDTAGSVRNPAACCGVVGLKTSHGRVPLTGVWPLAPSMDTVGPLARDIAGVVTGMALLEPGFRPLPNPSPTGPVGRLRGLPVDPTIERAVDAALDAAGVAVADVHASGWLDAHAAGKVVMFREALEADAVWFPAHRARLGADVVERFDAASAFDRATIDAAWRQRDLWRVELTALLESSGVLALAGYPTFPPRLADVDGTSNVTAVPVSLAGVPAVVLPVPLAASDRDSGAPGWPRTVAGDLFPASLQLVGPWGSEELLVSLGEVIEQAAPWRS